jgi:lincosamide and streptogramin A transport system ATP-binding/permease protein
LTAALSAYPDVAEWRLRKEAALIGLPETALARPLSSLSGGEAAKILLASLFAGSEDDARLALLDEPDAHLDAPGREALAAYLSSKHGFIMVSHDRFLLDRCVDHVLAINRGSVELEAGNWSSWRENRRRRDLFEEAEREKLRKDVKRLEEAGRRTTAWAAKTEKVKYGHGPVDRGFIGAKAAKLAKRAKSALSRSERATSERRAMIRDVERPAEVALSPLPCPSKVIVEARGLALGYGAEPILRELDLSVARGEIVALAGPNGCGKTLLVKALAAEIAPLAGTLRLAPNLVVSVVPQLPRFPQKNLRELALSLGLEEPRLKAVMGRLGLERDRMGAPLGDLSAGQLKKAALAVSLCQSASLYVWDEPLSHLDVMTRSLVEEAVAKARPNLIVVEHDRAFVEAVADRIVELPARPA